MRLTTSYFATAFLSSLAVSAFSEANDDTTIAKLLSELNSYDNFYDDYSNDYHEYKREEKYDMRPYQIHNKQSNALNALSMGMQALSKDGKMDMKNFDENRAAWRSKLAEIVQEAEGKLIGPYNMDIPIAYHRSHFESLNKANKLRTKIKSSEFDGFGIDYIDEIMRLSIETYKLHHFDGSVYTELPHIDAKCASIDTDFANLAKIVKEAQGLPQAVMDFYFLNAAHVRASLDHVKLHIAISKANDGVLQPRDFDEMWE